MNAWFGVVIRRVLDVLDQVGVVTRQETSVDLVKIWGSARA